MTRKVHLSLACIAMSSLAWTSMSVCAADGPLHFQRLQTTGYLGNVSQSGSDVTIAAGPQFLELTPASRQELCEIALRYLAGVNGSVRSVAITGPQGTLSGCSTS